MAETQTGLGRGQLQADRDRGSWDTINAKNPVHVHSFTFVPHHSSAIAEQLFASSFMRRLRVSLDEGRWNFTRVRN
jgi:hypothetical protein